MTLRIFSVAGEALHFGARRMETLMRVGWLPVMLLFIAQMATLYGALSVQAGRLITTTDLSVQIDQVTRAVRVEGLVAQVAHALFNLALTGQWSAIPAMVWTIMGFSIVVQTAIVAAIVAPMTRLAGIGEEPPGGLFRFHFGEDELRFSAVALGGFLVLGAFIVGPMAAATYFTLKSVITAYGALYAVFPNPESLHTIVEKTGRDLIEERGETFSYLRGAPLIAMAPVAALLWGVIFQHFRPRDAGFGRSAASAFAALVGTTAVAVSAWLVVLAGRGNVPPEKADSLFYGFEALGLVFLYYVSLRLFPVAGVAACRRSFRSGSFLKTTRRWNIVRLAVILAIIAAIFWMIQSAVYGVRLPGMALPGVSSFALAVIESSYGAFAAMTGWTNDGEPARWVLPTFIWIWAGLQLLFNVFWVFFSYGVLAGLLGRLYRESERKGEEAADDAALWMKRT